jgi:very-short-patch-repair endonuclease
VILSLRQVSTQYGMNTSHIDVLTATGALTVIEGSHPLRPKYLRSQVDGLTQDHHYVVCRACGKWAGQITTKHLQVCSGMTVDGYRDRWPDAHLLSEVVRGNKLKSGAQREHQSNVLLARFQTEAGEVTRRKIAAASRRMQAEESGVRSKAALVTMNRTAYRRAAVSDRTRAGWATGHMRTLVVRWHRTHRQASIESAAHARSFVRDTSMSAARAKLSKTSKLHLKFKSMLTCAGITGFTTEGRVGPVEVDEADFDRKIAVEVDGCYWHGCATCGFPGVPRTVRNDKSKDAYLRASGWTIVRVPGHTIIRDPEASVDVVRQSLNTVRGTHDAQTTPA